MIFVVLVELDLRSGLDLKPCIDNNLTCILPKRGFQTLVPQLGSLGPPHSDPLPMLRPPTSDHGSQPLGPRPLGSLTTGPEHMDLSKSFAAATEDSWMIISLDTIWGVHVICASHKPSSPKGFLLLNRIFSKPVPVFYREVDSSDFPQDIPRTLNLGIFFNHLVPRDSMPRSYPV